VLRTHVLRTHYSTFDLGMPISFLCRQDDVDLDALQRLYGEGLVYRTEWEANKELNETIGALSYVISRKSSRAFIDSLN